MDGSLLRTDVLAECAIAYLKGGLLRLFQMIGWLRHGRSHLKKMLAEAVDIDVDTLPVNEELVTVAAAEAAKGRRVILATSANRRVAEQVAARFGFFSEVMASDGVSNFKGEAKAAALRERFPEGFVYAGDAWADLPVWKAASGAIVVGGSAALRRQVRKVAQVDREIGVDSLWPAVAKAARPHQWAKNALVFAPLVLSGQFRDADAVAATLTAFAALCITASGNYLLNDLWDLQEDRRHWSKRSRPLASGRLPIAVGIPLSFLAMVTGFALAATAGPGVLAMLAAYLAISIAYSFRLKREAMLDSFTLAALYTARLIMARWPRSARLRPGSTRNRCSSSRR
jgi:phosphoserine phosphatase